MVERKREKKRMKQYTYATPQYMSVLEWSLHAANRTQERQRGKWVKNETKYTQKMRIKRIQKAYPIIYTVTTTRINIANRKKQEETGRETRSEMILNIHGVQFIVCVWNVVSNMLESTKSIGEWVWCAMSKRANAYQNRIYLYTYREARVCILHIRDKRTTWSEWMDPNELR